MCIYNERFCCMKTFAFGLVILLVFNMFVIGETSIEESVSTVEIDYLAEDYEFEFIEIAEPKRP